MINRERDAETHIDTLLEALARPDVPPDHLRHVLEAAGPGRGDAPRRTADAKQFRVGAALKPTWIVPAAAALCLVGASTWTALHRVVHPPAPGASGWGGLAAVDRPVLPPEAYWGMDPFAEWRTLRPARPPSRVPNGVLDAAAGRGAAIVGGVAARSGRTAAVQDTAWRRDGEVTPAAPAELPPVETVSIVPPPLTVAPLEPIGQIELPAITFAPIVLEAFAEQERP